jgi:hypothetical protein
MMARKRFVVVDLPRPPVGLRLLEATLAKRSPDELVMVMKQPPATDYNKHLAPQLLPMGVAGLAGGSGSLTSDTTRLEGLVAGTDILPTVLDHIGVPRPKAVQGRPLRLTGERNAGSLQSLYNRWRVSTSRRFLLILCFVLIWVGVVLMLGLAADRRGIRAAMRAGGLALLWSPTTSLLSGALRPSKGAEVVLVVGLAFVLGALTDRFVRWPRAPVVPCAVALIAFGVDLVRGSPLIVTSVYGSNPLFGSRFFGIGNELVAALTALALIGAAAALPARPTNRRDLWVLAIVGLVLGGTMGAGVLGAKVGVISAVGAGFAAAVVLMLRKVTWKAIVLALLTPVIALAALAALDLATGGNGHLVRNVIQAGSFSQAIDEIGRRYHLAFNNLRHGVIPVDTVVCLLAIAFAIKYRKRILAPVANSAAWRAALAGVAVSGIAGSLGNDSGPILLIVSIFGAACTIAYLRGDPRLAEPPERGPPNAGVVEAPSEPVAAPPSPVAASP